MSTADNTLPAATLTCTKPGWWLRICRRTYRSQRKHREHTGQMWFGSPPCLTLQWRLNEVLRENDKLHSLQKNSSSRLRYLAGRRCGCVDLRWQIRLSSRKNWRPQPSQVCRNLRSCCCRWWIFSVIALPSTLPHWSQRCSTDPRWTVAMWSFSSVSWWNVREQYSHTNDFSACSHITHNNHNTDSVFNCMRWNCIATFSMWQKSPATT